MSNLTLDPKALTKVLDYIKNRQASDLMDTGILQDCVPCGCPIPIAACELVNCEVEEFWYQCLAGAEFTFTDNVSCSKIPYEDILSIGITGTTPIYSLLQPIFGPSTVDGNDNNIFTETYTAANAKPNNFSYVVQVGLNQEQKFSIQSMQDVNILMVVKIGGVWYASYGKGITIQSYVKVSTDKYATVTVAGDITSMLLPINPLFVADPAFATLFNGTI